VATNPSRLYAEKYANKNVVFGKPEKWILEGNLQLGRQLKNLFSRTAVGIV